jgi:hypothetical protein
MKTIIINNEIKLVRDNELIEMSLLVPAKNLQAMKEQTQCRIMSKISAVVNFNHNAGQLYRVRIKVRFNCIAPYLKHTNYDVAVNAKIYSSLFYTSQNYVTIPCDSVKLYAFGDCSCIAIFRSQNVIYYNKINKISLIANELNGFGEKRYIKFKKQWYSNKKY